LLFSYKKTVLMQFFITILLFHDLTYKYKYINSLPVFTKIIKLSIEIQPYPFEIEEGGSVFVV
jgi:hypothetical protein